MDSRTDPLAHPVVLRARDRCVAAHVSQTRAAGNPYSDHGHAVASILVERGLTDPILLAAAYLHDVIEDTETKAPALEAEFGPEIVRLVLEVTRKDEKDFLTKQNDLLAHARTMSERARLIKLADRLHNVSEMHVWPLWKQQRYALASLELLEVLRPWPDPEMVERIGRIVEKTLSLPLEPEADFRKVH